MVDAAPLSVAALYQFAPFDDPAALRKPLLSLCVAQGIKGTLLLAREGINGTIAGRDDAVALVVEHVRQLPGCSALDVKYSTATVQPFGRMKVRLKKEIVTLGVEGIDPARDVGRYVAPQDWNALICDPDTVIIDTRNDYEVAIGSFVGAIDPKTRSFSEFPDWFAAHKGELSGKRVAMFCTGGIRCEKSTAYLRAQGIEDVAHLKGGILAYLEQVPADQSLWHGDCFVFDERVSVGHGLVEGDHSLCRACRMPLGASDRASPDYIEGVQCHHCAGSRSDADRARYAERHRQVVLAARRGARHVGDRSAPHGNASAAEADIAMVRLIDEQGDRRVGS